ncbi:MAG: helix-turn-helix transcriptional regulator [Kiloniellaceae bacterium]
MIQFLRFDDLKARGIVRSRATLSRMIRKEGFPRPVKLSPQVAAYPAAEVDAWLCQRAEERDTSAAA